MKLQDVNPDFKFVVFDIETIPNLSLTSYEHEIATAKMQKVKEKFGDDYNSYLSLNSPFCRVAAICWLIVRPDSTMLESDILGAPAIYGGGVADDDEEEKKLVGAFLTEFSALGDRCNIYVSFNGLNFDQPILMDRFLKYDLIKNTQIPRFSNGKPFQFDNPIQKLMTGPVDKWGADAHMDLCKVMRMQYSLDLLCRFFGIVSPKDGCDGGAVFQLYKEGKLTEIVSYCKGDVWATAQCMVKCLQRFW